VQLKLKQKLIKNNLNLGENLILELKDVFYQRKAERF
jgi:hypothetical protein